MIEHFSNGAQMFSSLPVDTTLGVGVSERDAAVVRADSDISPLCDVYYFEVTIVSRGRDG